MLTVNKDIICWISIHRNDRADQAAKESLQLNPSTKNSLHRPKTKNKYIYPQKVARAMELLYEQQITTGDINHQSKSSNGRMSRREEVVIVRL